MGDARDTITQFGNQPAELGDEPTEPVLKLVGRKFRGRKAIVTAQPGRVTIVRLLALNASTHDDVEAFTTEDAARAWLIAA